MCDLRKLIDNAEAALFDLDGVIIDSDIFHEMAKMATVKYYNFEIKNKDWKKIKHHATSQIYQWLLERRHPKMDVSKEDFIAYKSRFFEEFSLKQIELVPGAIEFVKYLKKRKIKLALVTAGRRSNLKMFSKKFKLDKYFELIITGDDVKNLKPSPEAYAMAVRLLKSQPQNCIVFEDTELGVLSGKSAGCQVVGRSATVSKKALLKAGARQAFEKYEEIRL